MCHGVLPETKESLNMAESKEEKVRVWAALELSWRDCRKKRKKKKNEGRRERGRGEIVESWEGREKGG